jgi:hypothetical protein
MLLHVTFGPANVEPMNHLPEPGEKIKIKIPIVIRHG